MRELDDLLPLRAPPAGGELRLRQALRSLRPASKGARWPRVAVAAVAALAIMIAWAARPDARARLLERQLASVLEPAPPLRIAGARVQALESGVPGVRVYTWRPSP